MKTTIGGDRIGSGSKQEVSLKTYKRSTHDLDYIWRSSMSAGTLVPFMGEIGLPGDSFDIELNCEVLTLPTVGPLFGSYKVQLDVFECPIRLYNGKLHMNMLNIGMDMSKIKLPQLKLKAYYDEENLEDNSQINASSILSYLNIRGLGRVPSNIGGSGVVERDFNAVGLLGYWDIYKNYYANKQEEEGVVIHNTLEEEYGLPISYVRVFREGLVSTNIYDGFLVIADTSQITTIVWRLEGVEGEPNLEDINIRIDEEGNDVNINDIFSNISISRINNFTYIRGSEYIGDVANNSQWAVPLSYSPVRTNITLENSPPQLKRFPLENIDTMRMNILGSVSDSATYELDENTIEPYGLVMLEGINNQYSKQSSQEGLGIKTYQSDLFNNWISTEWIDGDNGINEITKVQVDEGGFTIDSLNLAHKVYNMLNRIAISGGSYDDWLDSVYTHERAKSTESPIYHGSLIKELGFEEVVSTADTSVGGNEQPLGTLAGRGRLNSKNKGGKMKIKINEPSYIIGIVSLTPRLDYSQGNKWDTNLKTVNDLHKPALDEIGYQDLITDQMAWFDTAINDEGEIRFKSAGKQPAWINYMTNVNQVRGNFAFKGREMFMTNNRRYEQGRDGIEDLTTYIDPTKYNNIFAQTSIDAQNYWVQISNNMKVRRKISAKVIPNL